ncbi:MAG TPA: hypothetical protein VIZ59_02400 [Rubrobacteraceae bacterium]
MKRRRLVLWAGIAMALGVVLFAAQALIGANYYGEQDSYPWFLRALQWAALGLVLLSVPLSMRALTLARSERRDA